MYAYRFGHNEVFDYLLAQGASPRLGQTSVAHIFKSGFPSILHQACYDARWETVATLVNHGSDAHELDGNGDPLMILCIKSYFHRLIYDYMPDMISELKKMIGTIESCGLDVRKPPVKLVTVAKYALRSAVVPLVSWLLDHGLDISTTLPSHERDVWLYDWKRYACKGRPWLNYWDDGEEPLTILPGAYYNDTGRVRTQQTLLEYVCYHGKLSPNTLQVIELLLDRGCIKPGDTQSYVRAMKHLCCNEWQKWQWENPDPNLQPNLRTLCSRLSATVQDSGPRPQLPADLFYVCLKEGLHPVIEDICNAFDFANSVYSEEELMHFLDVLLAKRPCYGNVRLFRLLELVFQADMNNHRHLLQHERTLERLCKVCLWHSERKEGEKAVLDFLDRGGRYVCTFADTRSSSALFEACCTGSVQLTKRLLDMGADPNNLTPSRDRNDYEETNIWTRNRNSADVLRLLLERGGDPFRVERDRNIGIHFPFAAYLEGSDEKYEFYQELCKLAINDGTDDRDLLTVVDFACVRGKYAGLQELRSRGGTRVNAMLRDNAVSLLQKLLANLYSFDGKAKVKDGGDGIFYHQRYVNIEAIDEAIDTIRLLLELGPSGILESDWRLKEPRIEGLTALRLLEMLLTHPDNPHIMNARDGPHCDRFAVRYRSRIAWCLNKRIKIESVDGETTVAVLGGQIAWPMDWYEHWARPPTNWGEPKSGYLQEIPMPWNCSCEYLENTRFRDFWSY